MTSHSHLGRNTAAACHILLRKLPQIRQQDKKVNSHFILKRGAPAPHYICDMSAEKRAVRSKKAWALKNREGPKIFGPLESAVAVALAQSAPLACERRCLFPP